MDFTHLDNNDNAKMVDVSEKPDQIRTACAEGMISVSPKVIDAICKRTARKGNVLATAQIAGIQAAKKTSEIIPLCHNIELGQVAVDFEIAQNKILAKSTVKCVGKTGAEMEALTAVSAALLTVYDMCKAVDKNMCLENIRLVNKVKK
ncbi:MAG: cyclic pyranopterin monophosphate synthase MoaC [Pseudomonadota bacterium]